MNDGGPVFPFSYQTGINEGVPSIVVNHGISRRDLFAAMAMQGMVSCQDFINEVCKVSGSKEAARVSIAEWAYHQADAMLARMEATSP